MRRRPASRTTRRVDSGVHAPRSGPGARLAAYIAALAILFAPLAAPSAFAQDEDDPDAPWNKSDETLREEGWEVREADRAPGSVGCGLAAIVVSLAWRGWGHRCAEDEESHYELLIMEGVAIGLVGVAMTIAVVSNDADALNPIWTTLFYSGAVLFVSSYVFDLLGTFKGSARALYENHRVREGITPTVRLRVADDPFDLQLIAGLEVPMRYGFFSFKPGAALEVFELAYWRVSGDAAFRLWQGDSSLTWFALGTEGRYEVFRDTGFSVLTTVPYLEFSFDVGDVLSRLAELHFVNRVGYGFEFYSWDALGDAGDFRDTSSLFILESELAMNVLETLNVALTYRHRPDLLVGGLDRAGRLFDEIPTPGIGVIGIDVNVLTGGGWAADIAVNIGTLVELWLGFGRRF